MLGWIIPLAIMLMIWMYIMRRMSGGPGGGSGGGIFNIGKSKAELFDKNTNEKTNFKDVAGLEGAKEEVKEQSIKVEQQPAQENVQVKEEQKKEQPKEKTEQKK